ncbi:MAG: cobalamin biosynthesis protein [Oscillospiraceae bacterium]|nr:cobalamin biosynthesis protein [Oscillospiraceae bacterium]
MNTAIISFTEDGRLISERLAAGMSGCTRFCFHKHSDENAEAFTELSVLITDIFGRYDALVFISSVGIAVRAVAPYIRSKLTDPAVTSVDDSGRFAVSVLSGHIGGANELTINIAKIIGAVPVITTSTDTHGLFSPDIFAKKNSLVITDMSAAKAVASAVVNGEKVGLKCAYPHSEIPGELSGCDSGKIGICISGNADDKPFDTTLNLLPENIAVGIGCKKNTPCDAIKKHILSVFSDNGLDIRRLSAAATIDIKAEEPGLIGFCEEYGLVLKTYTADELMSVTGDFTHSDFVEKTTGADNVCERAAVCEGGRIIIPKTAQNGVTAAVAEMPVFIDFERKDT